MSLPALISKLQATYPAAQCDGFTFASIDSALSIHIEGTDVHPSLRDQSSNKDQIDLTYGATLPDGMSPVDDFFPTIVRPKNLPQSRHLKIPSRIWGQCLADRKQEWVADESDVVRLDRNQGKNPSLQLRGVDALRRRVPGGDWIVFVHQSGQSRYEVFSLRRDEWSNPSGRSKEVICSDAARPTRVDFRLRELQAGGAITGTVAFGEADQMEGITNQFRYDAETAFLRVDQKAFQRLASCLLAKRFLIATGLAGSGKTKLAQAFARWLSTPDGCYEVVPVGADWTGNENVLGYPNGLDKETYVSKPALDLILHAEKHELVPHFLILDEMNLSHVERYFADILSVIESEQEVRLYDGADRLADGNPIPRSVELPKNLFIIGTVNVDETTYMFSPKVLDRANVIEFRMDAGELEGFLGNPAKPDLAKLDGKGATFGKAFVDAAKNPVAVPDDVKTAYDAEMLLLFKTLQAHGAEFGYRTAYETARFVHFYKLLGNHPNGDTSWFPGAFDCVVFQKLLPKLHGSRAKLGPVLKKLWFLCVNDAAGRGADALKAAEEAARSTDKKAEPSVIVPAGAPYPLSAEKIGRMWRLLIENGFASFAEA